MKFEVETSVSKNAVVIIGLMLTIVVVAGIFIAKLARK